eukprot:gene22323-29399_t
MATPIGDAVAAYEDTLAEYEDDEYDDEYSTAPSRFVRKQEPTYAAPSVTESGTLRPSAEWYPTWMQYRRREDNYVFWQDKFVRCSLEIPDVEMRWTVFSSLWWLVMESRYQGVPASLRYLFHLGQRFVMQKIYEAHRTVVLWQCKLDAYLASHGSGGEVATFSMAMAFRRLHMKSNVLGEVLYAINLYKTGRIYMLPPPSKSLRRPTFFWLF